jgi:hypothetical protein
VTAPQTVGLLFDSATAQTISVFAFDVERDDAVTTDTVPEFADPTIG